MQDAGPRIPPPSARLAPPGPLPIPAGRAHPRGGLDQSRTAASRASATASKRARLPRRARRAASHPTQVMSANTAPGCACLPHRSSSSTSSGDDGRALAQPLAGSGGRRRWHPRRRPAPSRVTSPSSSNQLTICCCKSYSLSERPARSAAGSGRERPILDAIERSDARGAWPAARASTTASNCWTRSPDDTISTPRASHHLDRAGIHPREVRDGAHRASTPSPPSSGPTAARSARPRAAAGPHTPSCSPAAHRGCGARWRAPARAARPVAGNQVIPAPRRHVRAAVRPASCAAIGLEP